jgi:hypothetical protein
MRMGNPVYDVFSGAYRYCVKLLVRLLIGTLPVGLPLARTLVTPQGGEPPSPRLIGNSGGSKSIKRAPEAYSPWRFRG